MKLPPETESKVTVEDLLRLKRAERPPAEFWAEFDAGLRRKQLVAMVERKSVWHTIAGGLTRWTWVGLPAGAVAAAAFAWVVVRPASAPVAPVNNPESLPAEMASKDLAQPSSPVLVAETTRVEATLPATSAAPAEEPAQAVATGSAASKGSLDYFASVPTVPVTAEGFGSTLSLDPAFRSDFRPTAAVMPARTVSSTPAEDDFSAWSDPKKARLMAYADTTLSSSSTDRLRAGRTPDRVARRLSQQALEDSMGRLDMDGGRLTIRF